MSEISVLSSQYDMLAGTSSKVNDSVIALKKKKLITEPGSGRRYPNLAVSGEEVRAAKQTLLDFLRNVLVILSDDSSSSKFVPPLALADYKDKLLTQTYLPGDISSIIGRIEQNQALSETDLEVLDWILSILDGERSMLFRKLRKARG